jgi:hypothetical protein
MLIVRGHPLPVFLVDVVDVHGAYGAFLARFVPLILYPLSWHSWHIAPGWHQVHLLLLLDAGGHANHASRSYSSSSPQSATNRLRYRLIGATYGPTIHEATWISHYYTIYLSWWSRLTSQVLPCHHLLLQPNQLFGSIWFLIKSNTNLFLVLLGFTAVITVGWLQSIKSPI